MIIYQITLWYEIGMWSLHLQGFWQHSLQWDHQREEKLAEIKKEDFRSWLTKCLTNIQSSLEAINTITQNKSRKVQSKPENKICSMCWYLENRPNEKKNIYMRMRENSLNAWDRRVVKSVLCFWGFVNKVEKISAKIKYHQGPPPNTTNSEGNSGKITPQQQDMCKMSRAWYQKTTYDQENHRK